jgi:uncharacterized protein
VVLASAGVDDGIATAPAYRRDDGPRLALWLALVLLFATLAYTARATEGKPDPQTLYEYSTAVGGLIQDAVLLGLIVAIAWGRLRLLALRRPQSLASGAGLVAAAFVAAYVFEIAYGAVLHPGNEQGLTPSHWEPAHAAAYVVNGIVICTWVPFVEELTFRGLGYSLLERFGRWPAIVAVGILFGLVHGLVETLPVLVVLGSMLAWIRSRTDSVVPGMFLHALFNLAALILAVAS